MPPKNTHEKPEEATRRSKRQRGEEPDGASADNSGGGAGASAATPEPASIPALVGLAPGAGGFTGQTVGSLTALPMAPASLQIPEDSDLTRLFRFFNRLDELLWAACNSEGIAFPAEVSVFTNLLQNLVEVMSAFSKPEPDFSEISQLTGVFLGGVESVRQAGGGRKGAEIDSASVIDESGEARTWHFLSSEEGLRFPQRISSIIIEIDLVVLKYFARRQKEYYEWLIRDYNQQQSILQPTRGVKADEVFMTHFPSFSGVMDGLNQKIGKDLINMSQYATKLRKIYTLSQRKNISAVDQRKNFVMLFCVAFHSGPRFLQKYNGELHANILCVAGNQIFEEMREKYQLFQEDLESQIASPPSVAAASVFAHVPPVVAPVQPLPQAGAVASVLAPAALPPAASIAPPRVQQQAGPAAPRALGS